MLCSLSASLMSITRASLAIARNDLRRLSSSCSSRSSSSLIRPRRLITISLVTPSTIRATLEPNLVSSSRTDTLQSSTTS